MSPVRACALPLLMMVATATARAESIDPTASTVTADRTEALADGVDRVTVSVRVLKQSGDPYPDRQVTLSVSGALNTIVQPARTGADGRCTGSVTTTRAGLKTIRASVRHGNAQTLLDAATQVQFISVADLRLDAVSPRFSPVEGAHTATLHGEGFTRPGAGTPTVR